MDFRTDVVIVGTGVAGTFSALNLPIPSDFPLPPNRKYYYDYQIRFREQ